MKMEYYKNQKNGEVYAYDEDQVAAGYVAAGLVKMTDAEIELHLNPPLTPERKIQNAKQSRQQLLAQADAIMLDWRTELALGEISDDDRRKLSLWLDYKKQVKAVDVSTAYSWPTPPAQ